MGAVPRGTEAKIMAGVASADIKVLTAAGNKRFALPPEQQELMCLTSDSTLYVSQAHKNSNYVLAFRERLNRNDFRHTVRLVRHTDVAKLYRKFGAATNGGDEASLRQNEVIRFLRDAVEKNASDIHFRIESDATRIKLRVDGDLDDYEEIGLQHGKDLVSTIYQSMCDVAQSMFLPDKPQDARMKSSFTASVGLKGARVATRPSDYGQLVVLRMLYQRDVKETLASLGFFPEQEVVIRRMMQRTEGINIVGGPTGAGKSTTLETTLSRLLAELMYKVHLITVEDPPEYTIPGAVQTQVQYPSDATGEEISQAWARAISNMMRLDPDLMMIGEMRDCASAVAAFRAAMTGHGVWTTLHANDVVANLGRLRDIGVDMSLITDPQIVTGLVSQRLVKKVCPNCRRPFLLNRTLVAADVAERVERFCNPREVYLKGPGCEVCKGRGTKGRILVAEVMMPTKAFMQEFKNHGANDARNYWVKKLDGLTRNQALIRRINEGIVDPTIGESKVCVLDEDLITLE